MCHCNFEGCEKPIDESEYVLGEKSLKFCSGHKEAAELAIDFGPQEAIKFTIKAMGGHLGIRRRLEESDA